VKRVEPEPSPKRSVLLYGPPKTGKTAGACSAPGPVLLVNCDLPNASWYAHHEAFLKQRDLIEVEYEGFDETLVAIGKSLKAGDLTFGGLSEKPVQTIVVDPIGELYRRMLDQFSNHAVSPSLPTYGTTSTHFERFLRSLCENKDVNFVMTAHEFPVQDEATGEVEKLLWAGTKSGSASMSQKLMGMVDVVGYTAVVQQEDTSWEYVAQLVNGKGRRGGDRFDGLLKQGEIARPVNLTEWFAAPVKAAPEPQERKAA
jgi:hypothetical protein